MAGARIWGRSIWIWRLQGLIVVASLVCAVLSLTVSGRVLALMMVVAQLFIAAVAYVRWRERERIREIDGIDEDGVWVRD